MGRFNRTKKEDIGLAPDAMLYRGKSTNHEVQISAIQFNSKELNETTISNLNDFNASANHVSWVDVNGVNNLEFMQSIGKRFDIRSSLISDIMNTHSRPRIYHLDNTIFISIKMLKYDETINEVTSENLALILKDDMLITFQEKKGDVFDPVRDRIRDSNKKIRAEHSDYLAIALLDVIVDNYNYIIGRIGDKIDLIDEQLIADKKFKPEDEIYSLKSEIIYMNRAIRPCRELFSTLLKSNLGMEQSKFTNNADELLLNINHASDALDSYRELLSEQLNFVHTRANNNMNETMRFLTVFSAIFIPITFIVGVYGTNFKYIPELGQRNGYFIMWAAMIVIALGMIILFKRKKWL